MTDYATNPNRRCIHCNGREVITIEEDKVSSNLMTVTNGLECIDKKECKQNIEAENTMISFDPDILSVAITNKDLTMSVDFESDLAKEVLQNDGR